MMGTRWQQKPILHRSYRLETKENWEKLGNSKEGKADKEKQYRRGIKSLVD